MISYLRGFLVARNAQFVVIDVGGVGYQVFMPSVAAEALGTIGEEVTAYTYMQVSEAGVALYGFANEQEKAVFEKLISVSGVGPKVAISALSAYSSNDLMGIIATQDAARLAKIPGIGKKTAQRILVDLKDSFESFAAMSIGDTGADAQPAIQGSEAVEALLSMGFTMEEANLAIKSYTGPDDTQEIVRFALKRLGGF
ncbi:MAG: Holliday junction branch migration protein RuvA [Coriobacteriales bacterium]|nr:Holliday junction branch migration protein RuvA [Coriobacteriales bacterium]